MNYDVYPVYLSYKYDTYLLQKLSNVFIAWPYIYAHNILYTTTLPNLINYVNNVYLHWFDDKMLWARRFCTSVIIIAIQSALGEPFCSRAFVLEVLKARFFARVKPFFKDLVEDE